MPSTTNACEDVKSYAEKWAAERAARRVYGVKGVAEEINVRYPFDKVEDTDIAQNALQALSSDIEVLGYRSSDEQSDGQGRGGLGVPLGYLGLALSEQRRRS
jgi:hypothetical protein